MTVLAFVNRSLSPLQGPSYSAGLLCALVGFWVAKPAIAQESLYQSLQNAQVVRVVNGETVILQFENQSRLKVKLACVAAPEPPSSPYGKAAKRIMTETLEENTAVRVSLVAERRFAPPQVVLYRGGTALQLLLVQEGAVQIDTRNGELDLCAQVLAYQGDQGSTLTLSDALLTAEAQARQNRQGIWQQANPIPPWEMRAGTRNLLIFGGGIVMASISGLYSIQFLVQEWRDRANPQIAPDEAAPVSLPLNIQAFQSNLSGFLSDTNTTEQFVKQLEEEAEPEQIAEVYRHFRYAAHTAIATLGFGAVFPVYRDIARIHYTRQGEDPAQVGEHIDRDLSALRADHGV